MFDGKTWGGTNDGKTCRAPIGGKKLIFEGRAWGSMDDGKTCGTIINGRVRGNTNDGRCYGYHINLSIHIHI